MSQPKIILIGGPTASGKSAYALDLARQLKGVVINADALQMYDGLPILTAQPSSDDVSHIPHRGYAHLPPTESSSVAMWLRFVKIEIIKATEEQRTPILVGGTGLYFRALTQGLSEIPDIPLAVREEVRHLYDQLGEEQFRRTLQKIDADSAEHLKPNDRQRLIRAFEVAQHTGKPLHVWHQESHQEKSSQSEDMLDIDGYSFDLERHLLMPLRYDIYKSCDRRFENMIARGAVDEVKRFRSLCVAANSPITKTIGLRELGAFLDGKQTLESSIEAAQLATRHYAKRQVTWFKNQWKNVKATNFF